MKPFDFVGTAYDKMDCFALVRKVASVCYGMSLPGLPEHSLHPRDVTKATLKEHSWTEIPYADRRPGDVIALSPTPLTDDSPACHVGICIEGDWTLHNDRKYGCIIQDDAGLRRRGYLHRKAYRWTP